VNLSKKEMLKIGIRAQALWLLVGISLLFLTRGSSAPFLGALRWFLVLSLICFVDLIAIVRTMMAAFEWTQLADDPSEKRTAAALQTFYWGAFKLACLGILGMILIRAQSVPGLSLFLGLATLAALPLVGGFFWSRSKMEIKPV
jgi:hypothetical protein